MDKKAKGVNISAVIDIGSNGLQLKICEDRKGKVNQLELVEYPLTLGHDTFTKGKIEFEKAEQVSNIILKFFQITKEYGNPPVSIFATTAIREAQNQQYILDQVRINTGKNIRIIDDAEEKVLIYKGIFQKLQDDIRMGKDNALVTYIGTGSLGVAFYEEGEIRYTQNIRIGSLRLSEILGEMEEYTENFYVVVEEYLNTFTNMLKLNFEVHHIPFFIGSGREIEMIARLCNAEKKEAYYIILGEELKQLYENIKYKTAEQLSETYDISMETAEILLPSMAIYKTLFEFTTAEKIIAPTVLLSDAKINDMLYPKEAKQWNRLFENSSIASAKRLAEGYKYDAVHAGCVEQYSLQIFDKIKRVHGLGNRERLLLQIASILHDVGKYINMKEHYIHSYYIIKESDIIGLSNRELEITANIARYHSTEVPLETHSTFNQLFPRDKVLVAKLSAIIRLADALDRSHTQKFDSVNIKFKKGKMKILAKTHEDAVLEQWTFLNKSVFFQEVYGIKAELKKEWVIYDE